MSCDNELRLYKGEYRAFRVTVYDSEEAPVDLTGVTVIEFQIKPNAGDADLALVLSKSLAGGGITLEPQTGATLGQFVIQLDPADTGSIAAGAYTYDIVAVIDSKRRYIVKPSAVRIYNVVNQP